MERADGEGRGKVRSRDAVPNQSRVARVGMFVATLLSTNV